MADDKIYVPQQHVNRGVAGYRGDRVVVVDAKGNQTPANRPPGGISGPIGGDASRKGK